MLKTVYHGSRQSFSKPELSKSKNFKDFGKGFYVTENFFDALNILNFKEGYVYEYELDTSDCVIKTFNNTSELVDYVILNRTQLVSDDCDLVIGDTVPNCSDLFKKIRNNVTEVNKVDIVNLIKSSPYDYQICVKSDKVLSKLKLVNIHVYDKEDFC